MGRLIKTTCGCIVLPTGEDQAGRTPCLVLKSCQADDDPYDFIKLRAGNPYQFSKRERSVAKRVSEANEIATDPLG